GAHPDAEVDLGAAGGEDCAVADDESAVRLRACLVGRERYGLGERRNAQPHRQQAGEQPQTVNPRLILKSLSEHGSFSSLRFLPSSDPESAMQLEFASANGNSCTVSEAMARQVQLATCCFPITYDVCRIAGYTPAL